MRFFFFTLLLLSFDAPVAKTQELQPLSKSSQADFQVPFCYKTQNRDESATQKYTMVINLYKATFKNIFDPESVWDQDYLRENPHVVEVIQDFKKGNRAQTLKKINLEGKTAQELHQELLDLGFVWQKRPLKASFKKRTYWLMGGHTTKSPTHKEVINLHLYIHKDGSLVRIKAAGVPDIRAKHPRRTAHAVKAVLLNMAPNLCKSDICQYDTSYQNEAFKVTNDNQPVPKAPSQKFGLNLPKGDQTAVERRKARVIKNVIMNLAHTNLKTQCPTPVD